MHLLPVDIPMLYSYRSLCLGLLLSFWSALPGLTHADTRPVDPCKTVVASTQLACYQTRLAAADRELNAVYQRLSTTLEASRRRAMQEHSRQWIAYKEPLCLESTGIALGLEPAAARQRPEYLACLYDLTLARTTYLKQAFGQEGVSPGLAGMYDDGFGGRLKLQASGKETYKFHLEVVRGPTFHTGEVEGSVRLQAKTARFVQKTACDGNEPCCRLTFTRAPLFLHVAEDSCEMLHGVRAYFAGNYWKVQ